MTRHPAAEAAVRAALAGVEAELARGRSGLDMIASEAQLSEMGSLLSQMLAHLENGGLPQVSSRRTGMSHAVLDSWPLPCELGSLVIAAEQAYYRAGQPR